MCDTLWGPLPLGTSDSRLTTRNVTMEMGPIYWHLQEFDVFRIDEQELHLLAQADMSWASFDRIFESCNCRRFAIALGHFCFRARSMQTCNQKHVGMLLTVHRRLPWRYYSLNGRHILLVPIRESKAIAAFNSKAKEIERPLLLRIV